MIKMAKGQSAGKGREGSKASGMSKPSTNTLLSLSHSISARQFSHHLPDRVNVDLKYQKTPRE
jgi:hypothetical protein